MSGLPQDRNECTRNTCTTPKFWCGFLKERCFHIIVKYCVVTGCLPGHQVWKNNLIQSESVLVKRKRLDMTKSVLRHLKVYHIIQVVLKCYWLLRMLPLIYYKNNRAGCVIEQAILDTQKSQSHQQRIWDTGLSWNPTVFQLLSMYKCWCHHYIGDRV